MFLFENIFIGKLISFITLNIRLTVADISSVKKNRLTVKSFENFILLISILHNVDYLYDLQSLKMKVVDLFQRSRFINYFQHNVQKYICLNLKFTRLLLENGPFYRKNQFWLYLFL